MDEVEEHIWEGAKSEGKEDNEERGDTSSPAGAVMEDRVQEMQIDIAAAARTQRRGHASFLAGQMRQVSKMLVAKGHDEYFEPEVLTESVVFRCHIKAFPTPWLSYLQRFYAHVKKFPDQKPTAIPYDGEDPAEDPVLEEIMEYDSSSHLLCHACEGFFIPVDFQGAPIYDVDNTLQGGWLGSSYRLMDELIEMCPALDIGLRPLKGRGVRRGGGFDLSEATLEMLNAEIEKEGSFWVERVVWFALYEAARESIKCASAIWLRC